MGLYVASRTLIFFILFCLIGCGRTKKPRATTNDIDRLRDKVSRYIEYQKVIADEYGWLPPKCDGLLFNSLAAVSGFPVDPMKAEENLSGKWQRHPAMDCYIEQQEIYGSKSEISRDMIRGLEVYLLKQKDLAALERIKKYGEEHDWVMGKGVLSRTYFTPVMRWQLEALIDHLTPNVFVTYSEDPEGNSVFTKPGFEGHLHVLKIMLNGMMYGAISEVELFILRQYVLDNPSNALFQALYHKYKDGDQTEAISILFDDSLFPDSRLPQDSDRYAHYLWQRDIGDDWKPCNDNDPERKCENITHAGVDFLFAAAVAMGSL